jgi:hypothetical protein
MWTKLSNLSRFTTLLMGLVAALLVFTLAPVSAQETDATAEPIEVDPYWDVEPMLLTAFYGLDNQIPPAPPFCDNPGGEDGMPVIFTHPIDAETLDPEDFAVTSAEGTLSTPICAILAPAIDEGENRTALLVGEFGSAIDDEPVEVVVVGELLSTAETGAVDFNGASVGVIPLVDGPSIVTAELLPERLWIPEREGQLTVGDNCPTEGTLQIVRVRWNGGITKLDNLEVDDVEREQYTVTIEAEDGSTEEVVPFALGNLHDGDNNHDLCLDVEGLPVSVSFPAGFVTDPNNDLNPDTEAEITVLPDLS